MVNIIYALSIRSLLDCQKMPEKSSLYTVVFHNFIWFGFEGIILKDSNPTEFILKGKTEGLKWWFNVRSPLQVSRKILSEQIVAKGRSQRESSEITSNFPNLPYLA